MTAAKERELIDILENEWGFAAMRAPASGGATNRDLPDVIAGTPSGTSHGGYTPLSEVWALEVKTTEQETSYIGREDAEQLTRFAEDFGARGRLALRFNANRSFCYGDTDWYLLHPDDAEYTETKVKIEYEKAVSAAETLEEALPLQGP